MNLTRSRRTDDPNFAPVSEPAIAEGDPYQYAATTCMHAAYLPFTYTSCTTYLLGSLQSLLGLFKVDDVPDSLEVLFPRQYVGSSLDSARRIAGLHPA